ncbi:MAG: bifunctional serine/threonine-protein kinase/formylglycine-generating enzyme family protein [Planctomycetota bacterium]|nr:bifunctional serine/threonine-protein kinase/formylglycine-generating enzyme family protein [Planctomycetota bacterium]
MSAAPQSDRTTLEAALARLASYAPTKQRHAVAREVDKGGMGAILEVEDLALRRRIAMKVMRADRRAVDATQERARLHRFLEEAQVTAQLVHPGVVPVHELGIDAEGRVYFTMALVEGRTLERVFELARENAEGWNATRALGVMQRVCETMAYAHSRGVVHRDLKPANVMVGSFGEVYVMDWGLALISGAAPPAAGNRLRTDRADAATRSPSESLVTMDGAVVGTPSYMSPEQARGEELDARSDVYAIGAMLYTLLAGRAPYAAAGHRRNGGEIVLAIRDGPPAALALLAPKASPELIAIAEKAMARDPRSRYADVREMGEDLRAFLEDRVVRAHRTGAWVELSKWVKRNRALAVSLLAALALALAGAGAFAWKERQRAGAEIAGRARVQRMLDLRIAREVEEAHRSLFPASPRNSAALGEAIAAGRAVLARGSDAMRALESGDFADPAQEAALRDLSLRLGLLPKLVEGLESRKLRADTLERETVSGPEARAAWDAAIADIAASPRYGGLRIVPQLGLVPLGADPSSGLWEFWHVLSGSRPERDVATQRWRITGDTGIVLVLLPGAVTSIGSREMSRPGPPGGPLDTWSDVVEYLRASTDWGQPRFDPWHNADEQLVERVTLDPCFASKYEMTQGQWLQIQGTNPSGNAFPDLSHPVEAVSWDDCVEALARLDLQLPTEAQWEHACRAGTDTPFHTGMEIASLQGFANVLDKTFMEAKPNDAKSEISIEIEDGFVVHAPVGSFSPNGFGLHDVHGNVWEWCLDDPAEVRTPRPGDGLSIPAVKTQARALRGGSWFNPAYEARSAKRYRSYSRVNSDNDLGLRPVRRLDT